jgi:hypothetical protein
MFKHRLLVIPRARIASDQPTNSSKCGGGCCRGHSPLSFLLDFFFGPQLSDPGQRRLPASASTVV